MMIEGYVLKAVQMMIVGWKMENRWTNRELVFKYGDKSGVGSERYSVLNWCVIPGDAHGFAVGGGIQQLPDLRYAQCVTGSQPYCTLCGSSTDLACMEWTCQSINWPTKCHCHCTPICIILARNNVQLPTPLLSPYLNTNSLFVHRFPSSSNNHHLNSLQHNSLQSSCLTQMP